MANIKNMQMWNTICYDARISIKKSFFGLRTTAIYNPTNSIIDAHTIELSPVDGKHMKNILDTHRDNLAQAIDDFYPKRVANGNYMAELLISRDRNFLAIQLLQFINMSYEPVTDVLIYEGDDAHTVAKMF